MDKDGVQYAATANPTRILSGRSLQRPERIANAAAMASCCFGVGLRLPVNWSDAAALTTLASSSGGTPIAAEALPLGHSFKSFFFQVVSRTF